MVGRGGGWGGRGATRGGAREHCSQKEMDRIDLGGRMREKSAALVVISETRVIYPTFTFRIWTK